jgi:hypothetical protein
MDGWDSSGTVWNELTITRGASESGTQQGHGESPECILAALYQICGGAEESAEGVAACLELPEKQEVSAIGATEAFFEVVCPAICFRVDAVEVILSAAAGFEPLNGFPLEGVGTLGFQPKVAGGPEEVQARVANRGQDDAGAEMSLECTKQHMHFHVIRKVMLNSSEVPDVRRWNKEFAFMHLFVHDDEVLKKLVTRAFMEFKVGALRAVEHVSPLLTKVLSQVFGGWLDVENQGTFLTIVRKLPESLIVQIGQKRLPLVRKKEWEYSKNPAALHDVLVFYRSQGNLERRGIVFFVPSAPHRTPSNVNDVRAQEGNGK